MNRIKQRLIIFVNRAQTGLMIRSSKKILIKTFLYRCKEVSKSLSISPSAIRVDQLTNEEGRKRERGGGLSSASWYRGIGKNVSFPREFCWRPEVMTLKPVIKNVPTRVSRGLKRFSLRLKRDSSPERRVFRKFDGFSFP